MKNEKGITLVELLAAIVIVGFLTVLIWRIFFQTIDYNSYAVTEQTLQQEANVILSTLQSQHTRESIVKLTTDGSALMALLEDGTTVTISNRSGIAYALYEISPNVTNNVITTPSVTEVLSNPVSNNRISLPVHLSLTSEYKAEKSNFFILSTTLSKLTTD